MKLIITIDLDNAAFAANGTEEIRAILDQLAARLPEPLEPTGQKLNLHDSNGNHVGTAEIVDAEPAPDSDLLAALREIVSQIDQGGAGGTVFSRDACITRARAAIAKATATATAE